MVGFFARIVVTIVLIQSHAFGQNNVFYEVLPPCDTCRFGGILSNSIVLINDSVFSFNIESRFLSSNGLGKYKIKKNGEIFFYPGSLNGSGRTRYQLVEKKPFPGRVKIFLNDQCKFCPSNAYFAVDRKKLVQGREVFTDSIVSIARPIRLHPTDNSIKLIINEELVEFFWRDSSFCSGKYYFDVFCGYDDLKIFSGGPLVSTNKGNIIEIKTPERKIILVGKLE